MVSWLKDIQLNPMSNFPFSWYPEIFTSQISNRLIFFPFQSFYTYFSSLTSTFRTFSILFYISGDNIHPGHFITEQ